MKTTEEIFQEMLDSFARRTGLEIQGGCDLAARLYAVAAQVYSLLVQGEWTVRQCFPQTAEGAYLERHAQLRGLERKQAACAQGVVRFFAGQGTGVDRTVGQGTVCMTAGLVRFETTREAVLAAGASYVDVPVRALEPGSQGNILAGAIVSMAVAPVGVRSCTNPEAFAGGGDTETDEELRERVMDTFQRLPNGANAAFYEQGALSFEQVAAAAVIPRSRGKGTVDVIAATLEGAPDQALLEELQAYFQSRREIAVDVQVRAPTLLPVNVTVKVKARSGQKQETLEQVEERLRGWFTGKRLGQGVLLAQLGALVYGCPGVENYQITVPGTDIPVTREQLPVLSTLKVEELA